MRNTVKISFILMVVIGMVSLVNVPATQALTLELDDLSTLGVDFSIEDNGLGDTNSLSGVIQFSGWVGGFNIQANTVISNPILGDPSTAVLSLSDTTATTSGGGQLQIRATDTNYSLLDTGLATLTSGIGGSSIIGNATVEAWQYLDLENNKFGTTGSSIVSVQHPVLGGAFSDIQTTTFQYSSGTSFSITEVALITLAAGEKISFDQDSTASIPDVSAVFLLGSACLIGFSGLRRKFKK